MARTFFFSFEHNHRPATAEYSVGDGGAYAQVEKAWYDEDSAGGDYIDLTEIDVTALEERIIANFNPADHYGD